MQRHSEKRSPEITGCSGCEPIPQVNFTAKQTLGWVSNLIGNLCAQVKRKQFFVYDCNEEMDLRTRAAIPLVRYNDNDQELMDEMNSRYA